MAAHAAHQHHVTKFNPKYAVELDIEACFDNISHDYLLDNIPIAYALRLRLRRSGAEWKR
jgi:retron-type reverse transcriptase